MDERTDEELIVAYCDDADEAAFAELVRRHLGTVYSFAVRFVGNEHEAEDITQETFLKAWKSIANYRVEASRFKTWVLRIARNTSIDYLRKKKHIVFSEFDTDAGQNVLTETVPDTNDLPDELFARVQDAEVVARALDTLQPKFKEVLLLHYTNHLTFDEIGLMLEESPNTVKSRHRRALQTLRVYLKDYEH